MIIIIIVIYQYWILSILILIINILYKYYIVYTCDFVPCDWHLGYAFNWRECRGQTTANHKRMSCYVDCQEFSVNGP